jgi:hypothetical protein
MPENLLRNTWGALDQSDLRLLLQERIGRPGQYDGAEDVLHLPLAREKCRVSLTFKGNTIVAIEQGAAFDRRQWDDICSEIEGPILKGPRKVGRDLSFSAYRVNGSWRGERSGVQILPAPDNAPRAPQEMAQHPFILEFPIQDAGLWPITNQRRVREHRRLTLLLNLLLAGSTTLLPPRRKSFWACVEFGAQPEIKWVQEWYFANFGEAVLDQLSTRAQSNLQELPSEAYYKVPLGIDGLGLRVPDDLDESICRYQNLPSALQAKFDRSAYWMSMASRQWEDSMSASYASLVSAAEALTTPETGTKHVIYCGSCGKDRTHDVPGATEKFRAFFNRYAPDAGLKGRRNKLYGLRSKILHGSDLMQLDQGRAFGWDPPWWNEREMNTELWGLMRTATRNWLKDPT